MSRATRRGGISAAGWFGAQFGTAFLAGASVVTWSTDPLTGLILAVAFVVSNLWGFLTWRSRSRWRPRVAMQVMLGGLAVAVAVAVILVNYRASIRHIPFWVLFVFPVAMLQLWFQSRGMDEAAQLDAGADGPSGRSSAS